MPVITILNIKHYITKKLNSFKVKVQYSKIGYATKINRFHAPKVKRNIQRRILFILNKLSKNIIIIILLLLVEIEKYMIKRIIDNINNNLLLWNAVAAAAFDYQ